MILYININKNSSINNSNIRCNNDNNKNNSNNIISNSSNNNSSIYNDDDYETKYFHKLNSCFKSHL